MAQIISNNWWGGGTGLYKYKWSVQTYNDLPTTWLKVWDVYNVVQAHTTAPKFPAWSNLAWTGTEWDVLGWDFDLSEYQKKLVEWTGIDIDWDTNVISVDTTVIAQQCDIPTDNCQLANGCGYTTCTGTVSTCADVISALWYTPYDCNNPAWYTTCTGTVVASDIWNAKLTIQKNGTDVNSITMNSKTNVTANISVPTDTSDLTNGAGFITSSSLPTVNNCTLTIQKNWTTVNTFSANSCCNVTANISVPTAVSDLSDAACYQTVGNMVTSLTWADDDHYPTAKTVADALSCACAWDMMKSVYDPCNCNKDAFNYNNFYNKPAIVDNLCCSSATDALSANQWKELKDLIDTYVGLWRFLSLWNSKTGQPISFPLTTPYTYKTWDWYMIEVVDSTTNYMPNGSSYTWAASTTVDSTNNVEVRDVYIYDGTDWLFQKNNEIQVSFSDIAWVPNDNACLCAALAWKQDNLTAWANIDLTCAKVSATNTYIITEANTCTTYTWTKWVAPYNTCYCYTNICIDPASWVKWQEWSIYTFDINTQMLATSACRNVRVKIGDGDYIPVMWTSTILGWHSYFTKANIRQYQYSTKYEACWALHLFTDSNTTYSAMSNTEATTGTCTSGRSIAACTLKCAINYFAPISDTAYSSGWDGQTWTAPSQNAVYDKIEAVVSAIPTVNNATLTIQKNWTTVNTFTANASSNVTANITVPTCVSQLTNDSNFISWISCTDVTTALGYTPYSNANPCGYTTCTGTISNCAWVISALGYTPYNSTNPNWYTTCTWTLSATNTWCNGQVLTKTSSWATWCDAAWWDVEVSTQCCNILTTWTKLWAWCQCDYDNLGTYDQNTIYLTI